MLKSISAYTVKQMVTPGCHEAPPWGLTGASRVPLGAFYGVGAIMVPCWCQTGATLVPAGCHWVPPGAKNKVYFLLIVRPIMGNHLACVFG